MLRHVALRACRCAPPLRLLSVASQRIHAAPRTNDWQTWWAAAAAAVAGTTLTVVHCHADHSPEQVEAHKKTLRLALSLAAERALPADAKGLVGGHPISEEEIGYVFRRGDGKPMDAKQVQSLREALTKLIKADEKIEVGQVSWSEATGFMTGRPYSEGLLKTRVSKVVNLIKCGKSTRLQSYNSTGLFSSTGKLDHIGFQLVEHSSGGVLLAPAKSMSLVNDKARTESAMLDIIEWGRSQAVDSVMSLNKLQEVDRERKDFMLAAEYRQEARLRDIVRNIEDCKPPAGSSLKSSIRVICIAGPTSSGKTTFATKLCQYLSNEGMPAVPLTVDHYYLPLDRQPRYQARKHRPDVDYDHIESMDVDLVNEHIMAVIRGETIMKPKYNMKTGYRDPSTQSFKIPKDGVLVIEGIHALNPSYTSKVPKDQVYKVFLSPMTALQVDECNVVKSTDNRLLRRMSRDYLFRGHSASRTLSMWSNVRRGEGQWIFPFQGQADFHMNSSHEFELCVLKPMLEPLLRGVLPDDPNFDKAQELLLLLDTVASWGERDVNPTSLLREFLGNGAYDEH